ncbi:hypothetical protein MKW92_013211 [Papaver armeniacum]|nr:hypothetical protein MKW92_013211 [Papaver armeniacum]
MGECIVTPVVELIKCFGPSTMLGVGYLVQHEKKIEKLRTKIKKLRALRSDLELKVEAAEKNRETINRLVEDWLVEVDTETTQNETMVALMNGQALDQMIHAKIKYVSRLYDVGKLISKKTEIIDSLILQGNSFSWVSFGGLVHGVDFFPKDEDFESFPSRESVRAEVMRALSNDKTNLIGVYGMGGIGKTMLINEICKQVKEEKLFEVIICVTVSQTVDFKRIQAKIGEVLEFEAIKKSEDETTRASVLSARLMMEQSVLIVLDDLWTEEFELKNLGLLNGPNKGCNVLVTTRIRKECCGSHDFQKNIQVKTITEDESRDLFSKKVGDIPDIDVATEIVRECNGLPIALVVLGRALRKKDTSTWEAFALQLRNSEIKDIAGMNSKVYNSIKLSYDYLKNDIEKKCFLLCCLFPEDHKITVISELMMYFICDCDTILCGFTNLKQARLRLHAILEVLTDSCLLLRDEKKTVVWMHDIIRDVAISIASEDHGFVVQAGKQVSTEWLSKLSSSSTRLSLMRSSINGTLPAGHPELPHLVSMSLEGNETFKDIPDGYFQGMKRMETLDLRSTGISKLPKSISLLLSLRSLYLDYCVFDPSTDISLFCLLKKLVILSLQGCNLERLPQEIGELTGLKSLNLSHNKSLQVPPNVISRLSQLEELYMTESFSGWEIQGWQSELKASNFPFSFPFFKKNKKMKASLEELTYLLKRGVLTTLHISLDKSHSELLTVEDGPRRIRLDVTFGQRTGLDYASCHNFLDLMVSPPICQNIMVLLERVETLKVKKSNDLKSMAQIVPAHVGFEKMKSLGIEECNGMESLMRAEEADEARNTFSAMEDLVFRSMGNLERLFVGPVPVGFIDKLKSLTVTKCSKMVSIFDSNLLKRVPNLEALRIEGCDMLREIFNLEKAAEPIPGETSDNVSTFLKLTKIHLEKLQSLDIICKGVIPNGGFDNLLKVELYSCDRIEHLFSLDIAAGLRQLKELKIQFCLKMVQLIAPGEDSSTFVSPEWKFFPKLETLLVEGCESFEQLWVAKTAAKPERNPVLLPELITLELKDLPEITDLHRGSTSLECPCLEHLEVVLCEKLKRICLSYQRTPKLEKIVGIDELWFESFEWEKPIDKQYMRHLFSGMRKRDGGKDESYSQNLSFPAFFYLISVIIQFLTDNFSGHWIIFSF